ncbi:MAG: HU family DNA-binding protein, partial [Deltaproteobacteria bacterium]|nr:HU family DNA-binding protein [Deltaproteobacteria bacterium]
MNHSEFIKSLSERTGQTQGEIRRLVGHITKTFRKTLDEDLRFSIPRLGIFGTRIRPKRRAYHPHKKKYMMLPPKRIVFFRISSVLKRNINDQ